MNNILLLEKALLKEDVGGVSSYARSINIESANLVYQDIGKVCKFKTAEIGGILHAHTGAMSKILGYSDRTGLQKLMEQYEIHCPNIGTYRVELRRSLRKTFNLEKNDGMATFLPFIGFLVAAMRGRSDMAKNIQFHIIDKYLGNVDEHYNPKDKTRTNDLIKLVSLAIKAKDPNIARYHILIKNEVERITGQRLPLEVSEQPNLPGIN